MTLIFVKQKESSPTLAFSPRAVPSGPTSQVSQAHAFLAAQPQESKRGPHLLPALPFQSPVSERHYQFRRPPP